MNLLLLDPEEIGAGGVVRLAGRRAEHLRRVLGVEEGRRLRLGVLGGGHGHGRVLAVDGAAVEIAVEITEPAPAVSGIRLIVALPRPQALHRILQGAAAMAVDRLELINAWRVEKSFFSSPSLGEDKIRRHLLLGAEQGMTTRLPEVRIRRLLVPFVQDLGRRPDPPCRLLADPEAADPLEACFPPGDQAGRTAVEVAIGPEGGWIDREVETFRQAGFRAVWLGPWILRVETAVTAAMAQLELLRRQAREHPRRHDKLS